MRSLRKEITITCSYGEARQNFQSFRPEAKAARGDEFNFLHWLSHREDILNEKAMIINVLQIYCHSPLQKTQRLLRLHSRTPKYPQQAQKPPGFPHHRSPRGSCTWEHCPGATANLKDTHVTAQYSLISNPLIIFLDGVPDQFSTVCRFPTPSCLPTPDRPTIYHIKLYAAIKADIVLTMPAEQLDRRTGSMKVGSASALILAHS